MSDQGRDFEVSTDAVLEQGDELLRTSRDLLAQLDRQLSDGSVQKPGDSLRTTDGIPGDS